MDIDIDITPDLQRFASCYSRASGAIHDEMRTTMNDSVLLIENRGKANAPVKTGTLRRSITHQVGGAGGSVRGIVGTSVPYAKYVHEGTAPHVILPVRAKALFWPGARHPVKRVNHPGTKANPFLRRALAEQRGAVLQLWHTRLTQRIADKIGSCS
jgi:HK97 gp10 family phage protein